MPSKGAPLSINSPASPPLVVASTFRRKTGAFAELIIREGASHLKKQRAFGLAKEKISKAFRRLSEQLTAREGILKDIESAKQQNVARLGVKMQGIKDVLAGAPMKVVFFGRTCISSSTK